MSGSLIHCILGKPWWASNECRCVWYFPSWLNSMHRTTTTNRGRNYLKGRAWWTRLAIRNPLSPNSTPSVVVTSCPVTVQTASSLLTAIKTIISRAVISISWSVGAGYLKSIVNNVLVLGLPHFIPRAFLLFYTGVWKISWNHGCTRCPWTTPSGRNWYYCHYD